VKFDVVGGKCDGRTLVTDNPKPPSFVDLKGEQYLALQFASDPAKKDELVVIYMLAGMSPLDAVKIWRQRKAPKPIL